MKTSIICICLLIFALPAYAGSISLTSSLSCEVATQNLKAWLLLENGGEEAAYDIQVSFETQNKQWISEIFPKLDVDQTIKIEYLEELDSEKAGVYPLIARVYFKDAGGYPMSTVVVNPYTYDEATRPEIFSKLEDLSFSKKGTLNLHITNTGYEDLNLEVNILVPDEFSFMPTQRQFLIKSRSKVIERFSLNNFSALPGAVYPVWAVIEYETTNQHFTHICSSSVEIMPSSDIFQKYWWIWLGLAVFMIFVFIWVNLKKRRSHKANSNRNE